MTNPLIWRHKKGSLWLLPSLSLLMNTHFKITSYRLNGCPQHIKIYRRIYVLFKIRFIIWIRKGPIKMLGRPLRVPWPFVSETPPHLKKERFHDWLRMKNSLSSQVTIFLTLSLTLSLSSNTYIVCRETESIEWPQKETPFTSRQLGRPSVQPAFLLMDGFLCKAWGEASSAPSLRKRKTINLSCEHYYCSVIPHSITL